MTPSERARAGLVFTGAAMELPAAAEPTTTVEGLTLRLTVAGIEVEGPGDAPGRTVPWQAVEEGRCGEPGFLPTGGPAVALSVSVAGTYVRWLVPSDQLSPERAMAVDALLAGRSAVNAAAGNGSATGTAAGNGTPGIPPYWAPEPPPGARGVHRTHGAGQPVGTETPDAGREAEAEAEAEGTPLLPLVTPVFRAPPDAAPPDAAPPGSAPVAPDAPPPDAAPPGSAPVAPDAAPPGPVPSGAVAGPSDAPDGPAPAPPSAPAPGPARTADPWRRPSRRTLLAALWTLLVLLVILAVLLLVAGLRQGGTTSAPPHDRRAPQRLLAVEVNLAKGDFPGGWSVDTSATGPLTGFLSAGVDAGGGLAAAPVTTPAERGHAGQVAQRFSRCLGVPASKDRVFATAGTRPVARGSSAAFEGPASGPPLEAGSLTAVYRSSAAVSAAMGEVLRQRFPACFGQAVTSQVQAASAAATTATTYGSPSIHPLTLPHRAGVRAAGVDLDFPVTVGGAAAGVQLGFVFVGGGRVAATLVTFGTSTGFPATLTVRLTQAVERHIAAYGTATRA